jgi:hypothetical protein
VIGARIAAALVSPNGHNRIRRQPIFARRALAVFQMLEGQRKANLWKGTTMRIVTTSVIVATMVLGTPAFVQAQGTPSQPEAQTPSQSSPGIRSIMVIDVKDLKPAARSKVEDIVAHTSEQDMQALRQSIDATPAAASALKARGLSSAQVVAINLADGVLTMYAKAA